MDVEGLNEEGQIRDGEESVLTGIPGSRGRRRTRSERGRREISEVRMGRGTRFWAILQVGG